MSCVAISNVPFGFTVEEDIPTAKVVIVPNIVEVHVSAEEEEDDSYPNCDPSEAICVCTCLISVIGLVLVIGIPALWT